METHDENIIYVLPNHRMKFLGGAIFFLLVFLLYTLSELNNENTLMTFFLLLGLVLLALWFKRFLKRYSKVGFQINSTGLYDLETNLICKIDDIHKVDVSPYTFKSANGFIVFSKTKSKFRSVPGLYWRLGNRISIGGLISKNESKFLSTTLLALIDENK